jgi:hypothetical protein
MMLKMFLLYYWFLIFFGRGMGYLHGHVVIAGQGKDDYLGDA